MPSCAGFSGDMQDMNNKGEHDTLRKENGFPGKKDLAAAGVIFLYCCLYAVLRLSVSSTMEADEAEQFLHGSFISFGYTYQPPFYNWIMYGVSLLFGMSIKTIMVTKYIIMFCFYFSFYVISRSFWNERASLLITGTLVILPVYAYEFNRDLSHSILVTAVASLTCYFFVRLLKTRRTIDYLFLGVSIGLGLLSKYNFAFFLLGLFLAAASFDGGRAVLFNKRIFLSLAACIVIVSPHALWLLQNDFPPVQYVLTKAEAGALGLSAARRFFHIIVSSYAGVIAFFVTFFLLFGFSILQPDRESQSYSRLRLFRYLSMYGLTISALGIAVLGAGRFSEKWLAPFLFSLPLAVFSVIDMESKTRRLRVLEYLCILIVAAILVGRSFIGFFPDLAGKIERIHVPFRDVSLQLKQELSERGIDDLRGVIIVTKTEFMTANVLAYLPGANFLLSKGPYTITNGDTGTMTKVLLWDASKHGMDIPEEFAHEFPSARSIGTFRASFLHSSKLPPFVLGAALVQRGGSST